MNAPVTKTCRKNKVTTDINSYEPPLWFEEAEEVRDRDAKAKLKNIIESYACRLTTGSILFNKKGMCISGAGVV